MAIQPLYFIICIRMKECTIQSSAVSLKRCSANYVIVIRKNRIDYTNEWLFNLYIFASIFAMRGRHSVLV